MASRIDSHREPESDGGSRRRGKNGLCKADGGCAWRSGGNVLRASGHGTVARLTFAILQSADGGSGTLSRTMPKPADGAGGDFSCGSRRSDHGTATAADTASAARSESGTNASANAGAASRGKSVARARVTFRHPP